MVEKRSEDFKAKFPQWEQTGNYLRNRTKQSAENLSKRAGEVRGAIKKYIGSYQELESKVKEYRQEISNLTLKISMMRRAARETEVRDLERNLDDLRHAAGIVDPEGRIIYANEILREILGGDGGVGEKYYGFLRGNPEIIRGYFNTPRKQTELVYVRDNKGKYRGVELTKKPIFVREPFRVKGQEHLCTVFHLYPLGILRRVESVGLEKLLREKREHEKVQEKRAKASLREAHEILKRHLGIEGVT